MRINKVELEKMALMLVDKPVKQDGKIVGTIVSAGIDDNGKVVMIAKMHKDFKPAPDGQIKICFDPGR